MSEKIRMTKQEFNSFTDKIQEIKCYVEILKCSGGSEEFDKIQKLACINLIETIRNLQNEEIPRTLVALQAEWFSTITED